MLRKSQSLMIIALLLISFVTVSHPAKADIIIIPLPVLNPYDVGSYLQMTVASENEEINATLSIGDETLEETLALDSVILIEHTIKDVLQAPQFNAEPTEGGFSITLSNIKEGQVKFSIEGGQEISGEVNQDVLTKITLKSSKSSKLQLFNSDSSVVNVDAAKLFFSFAKEGYIIPIRFAPDASGAEINTKGDNEGGEPDKGVGTDDSDLFPLAENGGCSLHSSAKSTSLSFGISLGLLSILFASLAKRRKLAKMKSH